MRFDHLARRTFEQAGLPLALYEEASSAAPVVFQHGLGGSAGQTAEAFPDDAAGHLVTLECRGHGASPLGPPDRLSIEQFASDIAAVIDELGAPVIVGGISMGAAIALRLAVHRPELVRALVLVRPAWTFEKGPANMQANAEVAELLLAYDPDEARRRFEASATARRLAQGSPDNLKSLLGFFERAPQADTAQLLRRIAADGPGVTRSEVAAIRMPTLVVGCLADEIHPWAFADELARTVPGAGLVQVTGKSADRNRYVADLQSALRTFIGSVHR